MTSDELAAQETQAERCVRRGDLLQALTLYRQLATAQPSRQDLLLRMRQLAESMDPAELRAAGAAVAPPPPPASPSTTPEEEGERLFQLGDLAGAAAAYRRALEAKPASTLIHERLVELFQLAQAQSARAAPARAKIEPPTPGPPPDVEALLRDLLARIVERRRP
jgi:tetratricopeptide (TPR) repeat protein